MSKPRQFAFNTELGRSCATVGRDVISGLPCANVTSHGEVCVSLRVGRQVWCSQVTLQVSRQYFLYC